MIGDTASSMVRDALDAINEHKWRDLLVPHGFEVESINEEERRGGLATTLRAGRRVTATLRVPVLYAPDSSSGRLRASLPADRDNLKCLRDWVEHEVRQAPIGRLRLNHWRVTPDEAPAPYLPSGAPNGPPADWTVVAVFDADGVLARFASPAVSKAYAARALA